MKMYKFAKITLRKNFIQ